MKDVTVEVNLCIALQIYCLQPKFTFILAVNSCKHQSMQTTFKIAMEFLFARELAFCEGWSKCCIL